MDYKRADGVRVMFVYLTKQKVMKQTIAYVFMVLAIVTFLITAYLLATKPHLAWVGLVETVAFTFVGFMLVDLNKIKE